MAVMKLSRVAPPSAWASVAKPSRMGTKLAMRAGSIGTSRASTPPPILTSPSRLPWCGMVPPTQVIRREAKGALRIGIAVRIVCGPLIAVGLVP